MAKNPLFRIILACYLFTATALPLTTLLFVAPVISSSSIVAAAARSSRHHSRKTVQRSTRTSNARPSARRRFSTKLSRLAHAPGRAFRASKRYLANRHKASKSRKLTARKLRSAYPADFFMWSAPPYAVASETSEPVPTSNEQNSNAINETQSSNDIQIISSDPNQLQTAFNGAQSGKYSPQEHVQAGIFIEEPLHGGIFRRRQPIKYVILHSTETGRPANAVRVIHSWNRGMRHPGAQYMVDRDGSIYQTVDPAFGTVHVDIFRTLGDVNNDNSIGIEIVHTGNQSYTPKQVENVTRLVAYLQSHFNVTDDHILRHGDVQPSDRRDPVNFDWQSFMTAKNTLQTGVELADQTSYAPESAGEKSQRPEAVVALASSEVESPRWEIFGLNLAENNFFKTLRQWFRVQL